MRKEIDFSREAAARTAERFLILISLHAGAPARCGIDGDARPKFGQLISRRALPI